jgi:hypothetical protein
MSRTTVYTYVGCPTPDKTDDDFVARHYNNKRRPVDSHPPDFDQQMEHTKFASKSKMQQHTLSHQNQK